MGLAQERNTFTAPFSFSIIRNSIPSKWVFRISQQSLKIFLHDPVLSHAAQPCLRRHGSRCACVLWLLPPFLLRCQFFFSSYKTVVVTSGKMVLCFKPPIVTQDYFQPGYLQTVHNAVCNLRDCVDSVDCGSTWYHEYCQLPWETFVYVHFYPHIQAWLDCLPNSCGCFIQTKGRFTLVYHCWWIPLIVVLNAHLSCRVHLQQSMLRLCSLICPRPLTKTADLSCLLYRVGEWVQLTFVTLSMKWIHLLFCLCKQDLIKADGI